MSQLKVAVLCFVVLFSLLKSTSEAQGVPEAKLRRLATIKSVKGTVLVQPARTTKWSPAREGMNLSQGDKVSTKANSTAVLTWKDGTLIKLAPFTDFAITKDELDLATKKETSTFTAWSGKVLVGTKREIKAGSKFEVHTPIAVTGVRGSLFSVAVAADATTTVVCYQASSVVYAYNTEFPEQEVILLSNTYTIIRPHRPPEPPKGTTDEQKVDLEQDREVIIPTLAVSEPSGDIEVTEALLSIVGRTEPGVKLTINGKPVDVDPNGNFKSTLELKEGANVITVIATNAVGGVATITRTVTLPAKPVRLDVKNPIEGLRTNDKRITAEGATNPENTLTINGEPVPVKGDGRFSREIELREGANVITITARNPAGQEMTVTRTVTYTLEPLRKPKLVIYQPPDGSATRISLVTVVGMTEPGATVTVAGQPAPVGPDGSFTRDATLVEGENNIIVIANLGGAIETKAIRVTLDTKAPDIIISAPVDNQVMTSISVEVLGVTEIGARLFINGAPVTVSGDGSFRAVLPLQVGRNAIIAIAEDKLGNRTAPPVTRTVIVSPILRLAATPSSLPSDGKSTSEIVAYFFGADDKPVLDGTRISFKVDKGTIIPQSTTTTAGKALATFTSPLRTEITPDTATIFAQSGKVVASTSITLTPVRGALTGVVTNITTKKPIPGVSVALNTGETALTDSLGRYTFPSLPAGPYSLTATHPSYITQSKSETVEVGKLKSVDLYLTPIVLPPPPPAG